MDLFVSIIIPIYQVERYLRHCLQTVANQSRTEGVECVLIDDCGGDDSVKIAENFIQDYQGNVDFVLLHHEKNSGLSAARNTGIRAARGKYVYFLDSDDAITEDCIEGLVKITEDHPGIDLVLGLIDQDTPYMNQFAARAYPSYTEDRRYIKRALLDYDELPVCAANKMVLRQLILDNQLFFKEGIIHEDNYWSFFLAKHVRSLAVYPRKCYLYTVNPESITKAVNKKKEIYSSRVIIEDFCNHIDAFLKGEQKVAILSFLNWVLNGSYYEHEEQKEMLFKCLYDQCNWIEKQALSTWFSMESSNAKKTKLFNLCVRLFRLSN